MVDFKKLKNRQREDQGISREKVEKEDRGQKLKFEKKKILTPVFRGQFIHKLFNPDEENGKYSICALFDKAEDRSEMRAEVKRVITEAFGKLKPGMKMPFRNGAEKEEDYAGFDDSIVFCNFSTYKKPSIRDKKKNVIDDDDFDSGNIKSGDYFRACVCAVPFSQKGAKGVSFQLSSLQYVGEGEALYQGGVSDALDDFQNEFDDDLDDDFGDDDDEEGDRPKKSKSSHKGLPQKPPKKIAKTSAVRNHRDDDDDDNYGDDTERYADYEDYDID